ncbi:IS630 family transposase [Actinoplanes sp. NEAU-A12]|uniref:IS630 family transposase n=1 Tax=Actinoplanes sandaracinus TaxID=3045177 RepID=A0ABT6X230_9ACTN|nr:IS630 family transposase [Actinoplanes sandaracinus]MDI6106078.1 IS630 family transposase [Actinoplanes sandaracinus]
MPVPHARPITLTTPERRRLTALAYSHTAGYHQVIRARIVCDAARGHANAAIARRHDVTVDTVRRWRGRFADEGLAGLADRPRPGRPTRFTPVQTAEVKALACQLPAETGTPLSKWTCPDLAAEAVDRGIVAAISASTIRRILARDTIKPWQHHSWIFIRDPRFAVKAAHVLDLYARTFDGVPLDADEYVISSDEKTSIQARCRCHPTLPPGTARTMRVNHEYQRKGALAYLAAYDVHQAKVFSHRSAKTGILPFMTLAEQVMTQQPYASAKRVFWVVDNGSSHRGQAAADRLSQRFPNAVMVHTPIHASWLNQVEIYFSIIQRKVLTPNDFTSLDQVEDRLTAFEQRYNATARPFRWKFTPADLEDLMTRIERHEQKEQNLQQPAGCNTQPAAHALAA